MKVFTVHGIRRKHRWYENFEVLEGIKKNKIEILKFDFGYFTLWDFIRKSKREEIIDKFCAFYSEKMLNSTVLPCAIGHSFGTYILFKAMQKYDVIKFDRIIFCGSILNSEIDPYFAAISEKRLDMATTKSSIQGYTHGVFWERNTLNEKNSKQVKYVEQSDLF